MNQKSRNEAQEMSNTEYMQDSTTCLSVNEPVSEYYIKYSRIHEIRLGHSKTTAVVGENLDDYVKAAFPENKFNRLDFIIKKLTCTLLDGYNMDLKFNLILSQLAKKYKHEFSCLQVSLGDFSDKATPKVVRGIGSSREELVTLQSFLMFNINKCGEKKKNFTYYNILNSVLTNFCEEYERIKLANKDNSEPTSRNGQEEQSKPTQPRKLQTELDVLLPCDYMDDIRNKSVKMCHNIHKCTYCEKYFLLKHAKLCHERTHTGEQPYKCSNCPQTFSHSGTRNRHQKLHKSTNKQQCSVCLTWLNTAQLSSHDRVHAGIKPYQCPDCPRSFQKKEGLEIHLLNHNDEKPHRCDQCGRKFAVLKYLNDHLRRSCSSSANKAEAPINLILNI